ncbi:MAG: beta strand repeat-containing protein, partial [Mycobacterium sp.]
SITPATVVTGADGRAAAERVLGPTAGQQTAQASGDALTGSPVTFVQTAVASSPTTLAYVSGNGQTAPASFEVTEDLVVQLTDANSNGVGGRSVTWVVATGGGAVVPVNSTTDPNGFARTRWTLGAAAVTNTLSAVFSGLPAVPFTATASADVPSKLVLVSGDGQSAVAGTALASQLVVRVTDANDNPVENVSVAWTAVGGGSVTGGGATATSATNPQGNAQIIRTLGPTLGAQTTTAEVSGLTGSPVTFNSTATVGQAAKIVVTTQPSTTAANGAPFATQPVVQVQDAAGNNVGPAGRTITASIASGPGGGALGGDPTQVTDGSGQALFTDLRLTGPLGTYKIRFRSGTLTEGVSGDIALTVGAVSAGQSSVSANPTTISAGGSSTITVTANDAGGNPVQGVTVAIQGSGTITQPGSLTDVNGVATGTFGSTVLGPHTITATVNGSTVTGNATVTVQAGPPASIAVNLGNNQTAPAGSAVAIDPSVIVKDIGGNPVSGVQVTFAVALGGGSVTVATPNTNGSGIATVGSWTLGPTAGSNNNTLTATATGSGITGNPVTFTASATAGGPSASKSTLTVSQPTITAGGAGSTVTVTAKDANDNLLSGVNVDFTADGSTFASASTNGSGVATATYSGTAAGGHTIGAKIGGVTINATATVTVQAGAAANVAFSTPPSSTSTGVAITPAVVVDVTDAFGNPAEGIVSLTLGQVIGSGTLSGTNPQLLIGGSATFPDLTVDQIGVYSLTATSGSASSPAPQPSFSVGP